MKIKNIWNHHLVNFSFNKLPTTGRWWSWMIKVEVSRSGSFRHNLTLPLKNYKTNIAMHRKSRKQKKPPGNLQNTSPCWKSPNKSDLFIPYNVARITYQVIQAVTFLSPDRWRSPTTFPKGHVFTIPKRSRSQNYQAVIFVFIKNGWIPVDSSSQRFVIDDTGVGVCHNPLKQP